MWKSRCEDPPLATRWGVRYAKRSPRCARRTGMPRPHREDWRRSALQFRWVEEAPLEPGRAAAYSNPREARPTGERRTSGRHRPPQAGETHTPPRTHGMRTPGSAPSTRAAPSATRSADSRPVGSPLCETLAWLRSADRYAAPPPGGLAEVGAPNSAGLKRRPFQPGRAAAYSNPREGRPTGERRPPAGETHTPPRTHGTRTPGSAPSTRAASKPPRDPPIPTRWGVRYAKRSPRCARRTGMPRPHREDWRRSALQFRWVEEAPGSASRRSQASRA